VDRHIPTVKLTNQIKSKQKIKSKIKTKLKPWITSGILKSISKLNFYQRKFIKAKNAD